MTSRYTVAMVMTQAVVTVSRSAHFKEIVTAMQRWRVTGVPVLEEDGRVAGVVSQADLPVKEEFHGHGPGLIEQAGRLADTRKAGSTRAADLMTSPAVTIGPDATLPQAARLMAHSHVKRLPVVDGTGRLVGIVSRADLLKVFLRSDDELAAQIRREVVVPLFPVSHRAIRIDVAHGIVTLRGDARDSGLIPTAARLVLGVEGVVDVKYELSASQHAC
ncbi:CBS domain-containing protein [Streptomyces sp. TLI_146]|uniref:CBS domain-containing protein n=1 Tax=Streptomyces sp. TLI_146 TaxID=1938858 RepID=UPI000C707B42|nr:CBS domain-containing protein [Streptomyces sp. TLI_146]PKV83155.1 CBS domain protein [Streptomyces sp. TLI_146]